MGDTEAATAEQELEAVDPMAGLSLDAEEPLSDSTSKSSDAEDEEIVDEGTKPKSRKTKAQRLSERHPGNRQGKCVSTLMFPEHAAALRTAP